MPAGRRRPFRARCRWGRRRPRRPPPISGTSLCGMVPPTTSSTSSAPASRNARSSLLGQRHVRTGQDAQPDDPNVFLHRHPGDHVRLLADAEVDHLETGVAQGAGDQFGAAIVTVEPGLAEQYADGHQKTVGCWNSPHWFFSTSTISPTVQYALAQSTSNGIRFSSSLPAAVSSADKRRTHVGRRPGPLDLGQPLQLAGPALFVEFIALDLWRHLLALELVEPDDRAITRGRAPAGRDRPRPRSGRCR